MKNYLIIAAFLLCAVTFSSCGPAQYVETRPGEVTYSRPVAPGDGYLWIGGDWYWSGGRYTWREGRWERPRSGRVWHEGNWSQGRRGWRWNRGHWQ